MNSFSQKLKQLALPFALMVAVFVAANYFATVPFRSFGEAWAKWATWATIIYPLTFLINDLTNRFYGTRSTTKLILVSGAVGFILVALFVDLRIAVASVGAFLIGQQLDNKIFHRLRALAWWRAPLISSFIATFIDNWIFYCVAFWGAVEQADYFGESLPLWVGWATGDSLFKLGLALFLLLPYRLFLRWILARQNAAAL